MHHSPVYCDDQVFPLQWQLLILMFSVKFDKIQTPNIIFCGLFVFCVYIFSLMCLPPLSSSHALNKIHSTLKLKSEGPGETLTSHIQSNQPHPVEEALLYPSPVPGKQRSWLD